MTKLFRLRVKDGYVSPATALTNAHGTDMKNMLIPAAVAVAISKGKIDWKDAVRCVASGKDPSILITKPDAVKPSKDLEGAADFDQQKLIADAAAEKAVADAAANDKPSELELARAENRAPDLTKLTDAELNAQAVLLGVDPASYGTTAGLVRAMRKKTEA